MNDEAVNTSPKENSWTCDNCNNEINGGEECFTCMGCGKAYHDLCQPEEEETLCIRTQEANLKNPQLTLDQDEDETSKTIFIGDASAQDLDTPLWSADQQSKKAVANTPLSTSTPARNRDEENRRSRESS